MRCFQCHKEIENELDMVLLNVDGDIVCSQKCKNDFEIEKEHFLNVTIHSDKLMKQWWKQ